LKKLIFTNGCFDVIHLGHVRLLEFCSSLGHVIVGINSDASVRRLKGESRPVNSAATRREILLSLRYVDEVEVFHEDTPYELIKKLKPDIVVKGGDYKAEDVVGSDLAQVLIYPIVEGFSSSNLIDRVSPKQ